jgi:hypothetical protein
MALECAPIAARRHLIPDASALTNLHGPTGAAYLPTAVGRAGGRAVLLFPFTVPRRARRQGLRVPRTLAAAAVCDP